MFERDHYAINPGVTSNQAPAQHGLTRHAIARELYLRQKRARLEAEAHARQDRIATARNEATKTALSRVLHAIFVKISRLSAPRGAV